MIKHPAYIIPLVTLYFFSVGFFYEMGYLGEFGITKQLFLADYSATLQYSFYALLFMLMNSPNLFVALSVCFTVFVFSNKDWIKRKYYKHYKWLSKIWIDENLLITLKVVLTYFAPVFVMVISINLPLKYGASEARSIKDNLNNVWHEITLKNEKKPKEGFVVRSYSDYIMFREKCNTITHLYLKSNVIEIKFRSRE